MKRFLSLVLVLTFIAALSSGIDTVFAENEAETAAKALFSMMDENAEGTKEIYKLYKQGSYEEALSAYRNYLIDKMRPVDYGKFHQDQLLNYRQAFVAMGDWTVKEYVDNTGRPDHFLADPPEELIGLKDLGDYNWTERWDEGTGTGDTLWSARATAPWLSYYLLQLYWLDPQQRYIDKYFQVQSHFALNHKKQAEEFKASGKKPKSFEGQMYWAENNHQTALDFADSLKSYLQSIAMISKAISRKETLYGESDDKIWKKVWDSSNSDFTRMVFLQPSEDTIEAEDYEKVDAVKLAQICTYLIKDVSEFLYDFYCVNVRNATPNQRATGLSALMMGYYTFDEFKYFREIKDTILDDYFDLITRNQSPDGGFLEKSFNYNAGEISDRYAIILFLNSVKAQGGIVDKINGYYNNWYKLVTGFSDPVGKLPQIGNLDNRGYPAVWKDEKTLSEYKEKNKLDESERGYTSIYFPITGYAALRSDWSIVDSTWLAFVNSKRSNGHHSGDANTVWLTAYGRQMLLSGSCPWYGKSSTLPEWQQEVYEDLNHYFQEASSYKNSTVIVNGNSQAYQNADGNTLKEAPTEPIDAKWLTSDSFDYIEGDFGGGYYNTPESVWGDVSMGIRHKRDIIFVKDMKMYVVLDTMSDIRADDNSYRQVWTFAENIEDNDQWNGYTEDQVVIDEENRLIKTQDENGPNLWIMQFSPTPASYHKYYGTKKEDSDLGVYLGWGGSTYNHSIARVPKPDVHVEWNSIEEKQNSQMISVLYPSRNIDEPYTKREDLSDDIKGISGFRISSESGISEFKASAEVQILEIGKIKASAKNLLIYSNDDIMKGVVTECSELYINSEKIDNSAGSYEFEIKAGKLIRKDNIEIPTGFKWTQAKKGEKPRYRFISNESAAKMIKDAEMLSTRLRYLRARDIDYLINNIKSCVYNVNDSVKNVGSFDSIDDLKKYVSAVIKFIDKVDEMNVYYGNREFSNAVVNAMSDILETLQKIRNEEFFPEEYTGIIKVLSNEIFKRFSNLNNISIDIRERFETIKRAEE